MGDIEQYNSTYYIWKAWCSLVFHQVRASPTLLVKSIWLDTLHTLKGQWDCIIGEFDDKVAQHYQFLTLWKATHLSPQVSLYFFVLL